MDRRKLFYWVKKISGSYIVRIITLIIIIIKMFDVIFPLPPLPQYSQIITAADGSLLNAYLSPDDKWRLQTRLDDVNPDLIKSIISKEDSWFYWHPGVNPFAVIRAACQNIISGRRLSGASTITMQLVRILEPGDRTYLNKFLEVLRAIQMELHFSKKEILEMYLSYLPMGGNIEGIKAASYIYFNRPPAKLSLSQCVLFAILPNDPNKLRLDRDVTNAVRVRDYWLNKFKDDRLYPDDVILSAMDERVKSARYNMPNLAPHLCYELIKKFNEPIIQSTISTDKQKTAEKILSEYVKSLKSRQISNGSLIVIDNSRNEVVAYCGSADFYDNSSSGQVNGVTAVRSPGSTLKPFLYASAIDLGIYTPKMRMLDVPTDFSGYLPENYDQKFNGSVTFEFALVNSLNIPAVRLLNRIGYIRFINLLTSAGMQEIEKQKSNLGLSLILGGCGVTLEELTKIYSVFANKGNYVKPKYVVNDLGNEEGKKIFSTDASFIISKILSNNERPDFPNTLSDASKLPLISWKTGTSYGKRDAWAIGFNDNYTIGVWTGNYDGKGSPFLSGKEIAVPLLFGLFNALDYNSNSDFPVKPSTTIVRKVCSESGMNLSDNCNSITEDYFISNVSSTSKCDLQKEMFVSVDKTILYCKECLPISEYTKKFYRFYEPELLAYFSQNNISYEKPPDHNPLCSKIHNDQNPIVLSPSPGQEYLIEKNSEQKIMLQASSALDVSEHFWYVNNQYLGKTGNSGKLFYTPNAGQNHIVCINNMGAETILKIDVKYF